LRLYYLTSEEWAKVILKEERLKLSTFNELNDPFELLGVAIGEKNSREAIKILQKHWVSSLGLLCTSRNWNNPVMWAHYGDKHRGVCLGFDVPDELPREIKYEPNKLKDIFFPEKPLLGLDQQALMRILLTKFKDWEYEREWRLFAKLDEQDPNTGLYYIKFGDQLKLKEVIVGHRCKWSIKEAAKSIQNVEHIINVFKARPAFNEYRIVRQRLEPFIKLRPKR
jgi:hypothetical protein